MSWNARGLLRKKSARIKEAMKAEVPAFHRDMLTMYLRHFDFLTSQVEWLEAKLAVHMAPYAQQVKLLDSIPGIDQIVAWNLLAELGPDMSVFPDAAHCASWAGVSPGTEESAGVQRSGRTKKGNRYLRRILTQAAWANSHCKDGYLRTFFFRVKARRGWGRAIVAVAHKLLVIAYNILKSGAEYTELGGDYFDRLHPERTAQRLVMRLEKMGYTFVTPPVPPVRAEQPPSVVVPHELAQPVKRKRGRPRKTVAVEGVNPSASIG